jgi:nucleotide-binding universal stress UspA family protein
MATAAPKAVRTITMNTIVSAHPVEMLATAQIVSATAMTMPPTVMMLCLCTARPRATIHPPHATAEPCVRPPEGAKEREVIKTVAVGTDGSESAATAVAFAIDLAQRYQARLVAISSYRPVREDRLSAEQEEAPLEIQWSINPTEDVDAILGHVELQAHAAGLPVTVVASQGSPADVLIKHAEEQEADVLVVGNKGMQRRLLGSVPNSVAHNANCTVIVVKTV